MKTAITFLLSSFLLLASLASHAQVFSSLHRTNVVKGSDLVLLDVANGNVYKTRAIAVSNLFSGLTNVTLNVETNNSIYIFASYAYTTNLSVTTNNVFLEYVTNLYSSYANILFTTISNAYITNLISSYANILFTTVSNAYITQLTVSNAYFLTSQFNYGYFNWAYVTNLYALTVTNDSLNPNQYVASDAFKMLVSTRDGSGWTNLGAANLAPGGTLPALNGANLTGLVVPAIVTNALTVTFRDGVNIEMATLVGGGNASLAPIESAINSFGGAYWRDSGGKEWAAGFWTPSTSYTLGSIYMEMGRHPAASGTVRVNIYAVSGGLPTGSPLGVSTTVAISTFASANWAGVANDATPCSFIFSPGVPLTSGVTYAMVLEAPTFSGVLLTFRTQSPATPVSFSADGATWSAAVNNGAYNAPYFVTYSTATSRSPAQLGIYADAGLAQSPTNLHFGPLHGTNATLGLVVGTPPTVAIQNGTNGPADLRVLGGYFAASNALSLWPTAPRSPGDAFLGNSNGVLYQLSSGRSATWLSTNQIGAGPQ